MTKKYAIVHIMDNNMNPMFKISIHCMEISETVRETKSVKLLKICGYIHGHANGVFKNNIFGKFKKCL